MLKLVLDPVFYLNHNLPSLSLSLTLFFVPSLNPLLYLYYNSPKSNYLLLMKFSIVCHFPMCSLLDNLKCSIKIRTVIMSKDLRLLVYVLSIIMSVIFQAHICYPNLKINNYILRPQSSGIINTTLLTYLLHYITPPSLLLPHEPLNSNAQQQYLVITATQYSTLLTYFRYYVDKTESWSLENLLLNPHIATGRG